VLDLCRVPRELHALASVADRFGIADDWAREDLVRSTARAELDRLVQLVREHDDALDAWLAGPEAEGPEFSDEYIAFSAMRMAADHASST
jgi:hypothetical protein